MTLRFGWPHIFGHVDYGIELKHIYVYISVRYDQHLLFIIQTQLLSIIYSYFAVV